MFKYYLILIIIMSTITLIFYIIDKENLVSVWYQFIICSENITPKQEKTLKFLVNHELISDKYARTYSHEYSLAVARQNMENTLRD